MHRPKRWIIAPPHPGAGELASRLRTSPIIAQILLNRGISQAEECFNFLRPSLKCLHDPALIPNLMKGAERIARAIRDKEKVVIYGDYDVDGITATTILWHAIRILGGVVDYYIPHRIDEGYGLNSAAIEEIIHDGAKLIVTVDCGVTAIEQAKLARARGVDLIITDHHDWHTLAPPLTDADALNTPILPQCYTLVHPRRTVDDAGVAHRYPNPALCGAGVAFKLAWGIGMICAGGNQRVAPDFRAYLLEATALAALGTIADVVPLIGENRVLAAFGLSGLKASKLAGIQALIESAGLTGQTLDSYHVGFLLAPRLNACGRMGHAREAVEMLTRADRARAIEIGSYLEQQNRARQGIEKTILQAALEQIVAQKLDGDDCRAIVLGGEGWHPGVIGIVASRIVDRFCRPTLMISFNDPPSANASSDAGCKIGQGSGRSITGFHLAHALERCGEFLEAYGGHEMAAGLKVRPERFEAFRQCFCEYATRHLEPEQLIPELKLDAQAELRQITAALTHDIQRLGPFGHGNRKPLFAARGLELTASPRRVGKTGDHLQLFVRQGQTRMKAIAFGAGELIDRLGPGIHIDLAFEPKLNEYNGSTSVELEVKDVQFPSSPPCAS
jgi:single-stranded-DNA-specific exonuclease